VNGTGTAWGAISFVNALPTGVGSAAAIRLRVEASVQLVRGAGPRTPVLPSGIDTPVVRTSLREAVLRFLPAEWRVAALDLRSEIPSGRGLKSSSAVPVAIGRAVASAAGRSLTPGEAANFSADVSSLTGLSATGAFDDATASAMGGATVVETTERRMLRHDELSAGWQVVLWIPRTEHRPSSEWRDAFRARASEGRSIARSAESGRYLVALERNSDLVESVLGLDYRRLRADLRAAGALGAGISGMGPTLAVIVPPDRAEEVRRRLPTGNADARLVELAPPPPLRNARGSR